MVWKIPSDYREIESRIYIVCFVVFLSLSAALALLPSLFVLHLERNAISKLEPTGLLSSAAPKLKELYLTNNTIASIAKGALDSAFLGTLHLDSNQLTEMPTHALSEAANLEELSLSHNSIRWLGPNAFRPISHSLKRLYMDQMGMEKVQQAFIRLNRHYIPFLITVLPLLLWNIEILMKY